MIPIQTDLQSRVDNGPGLYGLQKQQTGPPAIRPYFSKLAYDKPSENIVDNQVPDFMLSGPRIHPSRLRQMNTGTGESYSGRNSIYGPTAKSGVASSIAGTRPTSPATSVGSNATQGDQHGVTQPMIGVLVKGLPLPLSFHVLAGSMQKVAEITITVSTSDLNVNDG